MRGYPLNSEIFDSETLDSETLIEEGAVIWKIIIRKELAIHSSAAEYLTFVASTGESDASFEMRYEDENIWLTQKMMAALYNVGLPTINEHIKKIYSDGELTESATIRKFRIVQTEIV